MAVSRRHFLVGSLFTGALPQGGFGSTPSLKTLGYKSPNERLNIASIGAAGRPFEDMAGCASENIVAIADVDDTVAAPAFKKYEKAARYRDFRKMLDKEGSNIDAVIVGCPDHMHATAALWAMERGKHVYVEKPLTRTVAEARMLTDAAAKYKVATQMGNQGYSNEGARIAAEIVWSGEIGEVKEVHAWTSRPIWPQGLAEVPKAEPVPSTLDWDLWLGIAPFREFTSGGAAYANNFSRTYGNIPQGFYLPFNWRGFFDFGTGPLGDMACHLLGAPHMALRLNAPTSVECIRKEGATAIQFPKKSVTRFEFPKRGSMRPVTLYWYDAATGPMYRPPEIPESEPLLGGPGAFGRVQLPGAAGRGAIPAGGPSPGAQPAGARAGRGAVAPGREGVVFVGEKGYMTTDTYGASVRLLPESRHDAYQLPAQLLTRSPGHHRDWIRACKGGEPACSNFSVSGPFAEWIAMAVIALRVEGKLEWDSEKMRFTNSAEANRLVHPYVRKGWSLT
jgi:predicted dehydrogenase